MKKLIFATITFFLFATLQSAFIENASAADISLGASGWYSWWEFEESENMNIKPTILFGPVLSLGFGGSFSLSGVFLYGKFKAEEERDAPDYITRFDSDVSLNYNINKYFKIFAGAKYMDFRWDEEHSNGKHYSIGPGLGVGATLPLVSSFYLLCNVSGTYTLGKHEQNNSGDEDEESDIVEKGINTNVSIAYYIVSASTSINLGFRYHYVISEYKDVDDYDDTFHFYGATLSAVYSFSI
jgi:hypothetical protein